MVATRRTSLRLQEKSSAPSSPVAAAVETTPSKTGSATKKVRGNDDDCGKRRFCLCSASKAKTPPKRGAKKAADQEGVGNGDMQQEDTHREESTTEESESVATKSEDASEDVEDATSSPVVLVAEPEEEDDDQETEEEELLMMADSDEESDDDEQSEAQDDEDISSYVMMAASGISLSTAKSSAASSSSLQTKSSSSRTTLVPDSLDSGASSHATYFEFQGRKCSNGAKLVADKRTQEEQATMKQQLQVGAHAMRQREEHRNKKSAGRKWFDMESEELTPEMRRDFALLRMRNYLDPKKFYKTSDHTKKLPKHFQMGVVIEGAHEFKSARLTKKERQQTFTDEIMADASIQTYTKRVFGQIQASRSGQGKKKKKAKHHF